MQINVDNLIVSFEGKRVIDNLTFSITDGEIFVILGKNGSGKSVTLKAIAGLIDNYLGEIGVHNSSESIEDDDFSLLKNCAYVFQHGGLFDSMTVLENIRFGLLRNGFDEEMSKVRALEAISMVELEGADDKLPSELSGGMQKRVGFARAISMGKKIIIYDDPTAGLDPVLTDSIAELMLKLKNENSLLSVVATHDLKLVKKIADKIILLYDGKAVFSGSCSDFFSCENPYARQFIAGDSEGPIDVY